MRRDSTATRPDLAAASGSTAEAGDATSGTPATDGRLGDSPSQGSGSKAGDAGFAAVPARGDWSFCQRSHERVWASTGRSGTWHPAARAEPAQESRQTVAARASAGTRP
jgi:hypothetical protein